MSFCRTLKRVEAHPVVGESQTETKTPDRNCGGPEADLYPQNPAQCAEASNPARSSALVPDSRPALPGQEER